MVRAFLITLLILSFPVYADLFDFGTDSRESKIPALIEKLKNLDMKEGPAFDEVFNQQVKAIENATEEEKLFCSGEAPDNQGKTLPSSQKELCMRELKKQYLNATDSIFEMKKKYLGFIHQRQMEKLGDIQKKLKSDIEKKF